MPFVLEGAVRQSPLDIWYWPADLLDRSLPFKQLHPIVSEEATLEALRRALPGKLVEYSSGRIWVRVPRKLASLLFEEL